MLIKVVLEVVATAFLPSLFGNLVMPVLMYCVVLKGHAIKGFEEPAGCAAELVGKLQALQGIGEAVATSLDV